MSILPGMTGPTEARAPAALDPALERALADLAEVSERVDFHAARADEIAEFLAEFEAKLDTTEADMTAHLRAAYDKGRAAGRAAALADLDTFTRRADAVTSSLRPAARKVARKVARTLRQLADYLGRVAS